MEEKEPQQPGHEAPKPKQEATEPVSQPEADPPASVMPKSSGRPPLSAAAQSLRKTAAPFLISLWQYIAETVNIRDGVQVKQTIQRISDGIDFKGTNVWVLIASIFIASIGLNTNSAPAIIGAMLISPLMGPILGMGLAFGTNEFNLLLRSLRGLGTAVFISLAVSTFYFAISPLHEAQAELLARTRPTLLDVAVAFFGGLSGIVAGSRKDGGNVIPGVAIATALMPPLCTAGYGLANGNFSFFWGALYLFLLNSVFICIATVLIVRFLKFPMHREMHSSISKRLGWGVGVFMLLILIPSGYLFLSVIREARFQARANSFVSENFVFDDSQIINRNLVYNDTLSTIEVFILGRALDQDRISMLETRMPSYGLENCQLILRQDNDEDPNALIEGAVDRVGQTIRVGILEDLYKNNAQALENREQQIAQLQARLAHYEADTVPIHSIGTEVKGICPGVANFGWGNIIDVSEGEGMSVRDTLPTALVQWRPKYSRRERQAETERLKVYLKARLKLDTVRVVSY